jgi:DNA-binding GntR family transcriptional regulator
MAQQTPASLYERIKQDILTEALPSNTPLKQDVLSQRYGVSRIPIRDAIQLLKHDGWLKPHGKRGVMIAPLNSEEAEDLYKMRMLLEPLILEHALQHMSKQVLGKAQDISTQLENQHQLSAQQHGELNWQFHACIYACAKRPTLFNAIAQLHQQCARYIGYHNATLHYLDTSESEHKALVEALANNKLGEAQDVLTRHIQKAGELLVKHLTQ